LIGFLSASDAHHQDAVESVLASLEEALLRAHAELHPRDAE